MHQDTQRPGLIHINNATHSSIHTQAPTQPPPHTCTRTNRDPSTHTHQATHRAPALHMCTYTMPHTAPHTCTMHGTQIPPPAKGHSHPPPHAPYSNQAMHVTSCWRLLAWSQPLEPTMSASVEVPFSCLSRTLPSILACSTVPFLLLCMQDVQLRNGSENESACRRDGVCVMQATGGPQVCHKGWCKPLLRQLLQTPARYISITAQRAISIIRAPGRFPSSGLQAAFHQHHQGSRPLSIRAPGRFPSHIL
jgi:hypothetical protein